VSACLIVGAELPVVSIKYGLDAAGTLRPDKLVLYLASREAVRLLGARLLTTLRGARPHGVPFTAELGGNGLVSWGVDPPRDSQAAKIGASWRLWVTKALAQGLTAARSSQTQPWESALQQIESAGVDPITWEPRNDLWAR
jgi:hypothetical protein